MNHKITGGSDYVEYVEVLYNDASGLQKILVKVENSNVIVLP
jgi:hypothetical protein